MNDKKTLVNAKPIIKDKSDWLLKSINNIMHDGYSNPRMKLGDDDKNLVWASWKYDRTFLDWFLWTSLYTQSWVFRNGIDKKSDASVADIEIDSSAEPTEINNTIAQYEHIKSDLKYLLKQGKIYGGAASAILIKGMMNNTEAPLDVSKIPKGAKFSLFTRDRWQGLQWEGTAGYDALGTSDFGKFLYYKFNIVSDTGDHIAESFQKFHYSKVLRCGNRAPTQFTKYQLSGWDLPEGQHLVEELTRDETTRASIASLISKSLIEIVKMPGIRGLFSGISGDLGGNNFNSRNEVENRLKAITDFRNFNNISFLDKEDEYQQFQLGNMAGLADILEQQRRATSGAMEIPEMILYGSADSKGLIFQKDGSTTPEIEIYQQTLNNSQEYILRPIMDKLLPILWRVANGTDMPEGTTYQFLPVFKEGESAKLERAGMVVNNVEKLLHMGVFTPRDAAVEIRQHSKRTGFGTNLTDEKIERLSDEIISPEEKEGSGESVNVSTTENAISEKGSKAKTTGNIRNRDKATNSNKPSKNTYEKRGGKP